MITKTIRAESMMAALETVQKDLGPEALIVSVRQVPGGPIWQVWKNPVIEVVAVQMDENERKVGPAAAQVETGRSAQSLPLERPLRDSDRGEEKQTRTWAGWYTQIL